MSKRNQNREKAAAGAEAPHRSVQSAIRELHQAFPTDSDFDRRAVALALKACEVFGGQIVKVIP